MVLINNNGTGDVTTDRERERERDTESERERDRVSQPAIIENTTQSLTRSSRSLTFEDVCSTAT